MTGLQKHGNNIFTAKGFISQRNVFSGVKISTLLFITCFIENRNSESSWIVWKVIEHHHLWLIPFVVVVVVGWGLSHCQLSILFICMGFAFISDPRFTIWSKLCNFSRFLCAHQWSKASSSFLHRCDEVAKFVCHRLRVQSLEINISYSHSDETGSKPKTWDRRICNQQMTV